MLDRVGAVGGVEEEHARLAVVVGLLDDLVEQVARPQGLVDFDRDAGGLGLLERAVELAVIGRKHVRETQVPIRVIFHGPHEGIRDAHGNVEVGDRVFVGLAGDELFHVRVIHAQHGHVGAAARAALGHFAEGVVVNAQEAHRAGGLPGRGFHQAALGAQARKGKAVAAAGLLDQGGVPQGGEDAGGFLAHVVRNGQHETGRQLAQGGAGPGKGGRIGEEALGGEKLVVFLGAGDYVTAPGLFDFGHVVSHTPEHFLHAFSRLAVVALAHVAARQHLAGVFGQRNGGEVFRQRRGG